MKIITATTDHINDLIPLFEGYRAFYKMKADAEGAKQFLTDRLSQNETTIFMAYDGEKALGFVTLYPTFSSVSMKRDFLLNDLFVSQDYRGKGVGAALLHTAQDHAKQIGAKGLLLETALDNPAQHLYEKEGFVKQIGSVYHYYWKA